MSNGIGRRGFLAGTAAGALVLRAPVVLGQARQRVVVIGGGPGGATAAKYIARGSRGKLDVVLVEPSTQYTTCFHSNLFLGGFMSFDDITFTYDRLPGHGVRVVHQLAQAIDRDLQRVHLADGTVLDYDRLIVAPGIDLDYGSVPGWGREHEVKMPHAWKAGPQTKVLKAGLDRVPAGGTILMIPPPEPARCPPAPYERVSMMAYALKASGRGDCRIIIIDPKDKFSKQALFQDGWERHYPGMVEWLDPAIHEGVRSVDPATNTVVTGFDEFRDCALVNVIPAQRAGRIARDAGLADGTGFCPVEPGTMKSSFDPLIHVLGDAAIAGAMPKSAFAAHSQAKVAAMTVLGELTGSPVGPAHYGNTCWSTIDDGDVVKVGASYAVRDGEIVPVERFISQIGESADIRHRNQRENMDWYDAITADIFG